MACRGTTVCKVHGGNTPAVRAAAEARRKAEERRKALADVGFWNPDAPAIEDPVTAFALHTGRVLWQHEFLGDQINISETCVCCGRAEWDLTILRELRNTSDEVGKLLDQMIRHGIYHRALDIEEAKLRVVYKGLERVLYELLGPKCSDAHFHRAELIFRDTVEPLLRQIGEKS